MPGSGVSRRELVGTLGIVGLAVGCGPKELAFVACPAEVEPGACQPTNEDVEGPFYRDGVPVRGDLDRYGDDGTRLTWTGRVLESAGCGPIAGAIVELWHADPRGEYDNDTEEMRYRGQLATDAEGGFRFTTLVPGAYLDGTRYRPAHLHVKVFVGDTEVLTTQLYFQGDPYLEDDAWAEPARAMCVQTNAEDDVAASYDLVV